MFAKRWGTSLHLGLAAFILLCAASGIRAQSVQEEWQQLTDQTIALYNAARFEEAEETARTALGIAESQMADKLSELGSSYNNLGAILFNLGDFDGSAKFHRRALDTREKMSPSVPSEIAMSYESIADAEAGAGRFKEAATFYRRAVQSKKALGHDLFFVTRSLGYALMQMPDRSLAETGEAHDVLRRSLELWGDRRDGNPQAYASDLINTIQLANAAGRGAEVVALAQDLVDLRTAENPQDPVELGWAHRYLAGALKAQGDTAGAERSYSDAITQMEQVGNGINKHVSDFSFNLGDLLEGLGRFEDAETAYRRALFVEHQLYGDEHEETLRTYNRLGLLLVYDGRYGPAEALLRRGLGISEALYGKQGGWTATLADNLALALSGQDKFDEAIALHRRALAIREHIYGRLDASTSKTINNLALALRRNGRDDEAMDLFREALAIDRETLPDGSWEIGVALSNVADGLVAQGTPSALTEAFGLYREALEISRKNYPAQHPDIASNLDGLAMIARRATLYDDAAAYFEEAVAIYSAPQNRATLAENAVVFDAAAVHLFAVSPARVADAFEIAQWPMQTAASKAIASSAQRVAAGDPELASIVRELQDLTAQNTALNEQTLLSFGGDDEAKPEQLAAKLARNEQNIADIQAELNDRFPDYSQFQGGEPAGARDVAAALHPDEALVFIRTGHTRKTGDKVPGLLFVVTPDGMVTATELEWGYTLQQDARALLCSVQSGVEGCPDASFMADLTRGAFNMNTADGDVVAAKAFNLPLAHDLYRRTLGKVANRLKGSKRLIIVPGDETLAALPFQILLSEPAPGLSNGEGEAYAQAKWLVRDWAISVLPNVSALLNARRADHAALDRPQKTFLGVGDPIIGRDTAFDCRTFETFTLAAADRAASTFQTASLWPGQGVIANVEAVRALARLPDTRCELEHISRSLGGGQLLMQGQATETQVKAMSRAGALADFRVVSFATHGLVAGEVENVEPALVLTPPASGSVEDDGLLTAGEIAALELNAEWVLLSACNTATGRVQGRDGSVQSESFSGLARAFFYAGARNLLVSHWPVSSPAAVRLTTATFDAMADDPGLDRATAFQQSMLLILDDPSATRFMRHPRYWAPFTLLGNSDG
ncbi:MAG: CHAT domain-containing tetratricopeptide repeat protein [Pseudomonadota bacterium]